MQTNIKDLNTVNSYSGDDPSQRHINYLLHEQQVDLINDIFNGVDTTTQYLFQFPQEIKTTFDTRKERATLRNFVKRAVQAFTGMIFRKPIEINNYAPKTTKLFTKIDTKQSIENFTKEVATALTKDGKTYILADSPSDTSKGQPYLMSVNRKSLINWRKDELGNFTMIVIEELVSEPNGAFGTKYVTQWRVYDENGDITIYRKAETTDGKLNTAGYVIHDEIETGFTSIPISELVVDETPMLYDIAKMNIKHFNRQSHKDRYLTMAALPIPVIWGADLDDKTGQPTTAKPALVIGVDEAFIFTGTKQECDFEWRELSGDSIDQLEADLNSIVEDITTGILRAAETASAVQKTATEVQLLQAEASNRVTAIANAVQVGMQEALALLSEINREQVPSDATFIINKDFNASLMGSDGARVIMESYLLGLLSMDTFLNTMSDMELINIESAKAEIERIKKDKFKPEPKESSDDGTTNMDNRTTSASSVGEEE